jgi:hypothetical protein
MAALFPFMETSAISIVYCAHSALRNRSEDLEAGLEGSK